MRVCVLAATLPTQIVVFYSGQAQACLLTLALNYLRREMRIAIYLRMTDEPKDVQLQRTGITRWLNKNIPERTTTTYPDEDQNGMPNKRRCYRGLKLAVRNGDIDLVIVHSVRRISLSVHSLVRELLYFADHGVGFVAASEKSIDFRATTKGSKQTLAALRDILDAETVSLRERVQAGIREAKEEGKTLGRPRQYTAATIEKILKLREKDWSFARIAGKVKLSPSTVQKLCRAAEAEREEESG